MVWLGVTTALLEIDTDDLGIGTLWFRCRYAVVYVYVRSGVGVGTCILIRFGSNRWAASEVECGVCK